MGEREAVQLEVPDGVAWMRNTGQSLQDVEQCGEKDGIMVPSRNPESADVLARGRERPAKAQCGRLVTMGLAGLE